MPQFERSQIPSMISMEKSSTGEHTVVVVDEEVVVDPVELEAVMFTVVLRPGLSGRHTPVSNMGSHLQAPFALQAEAFSTLRLQLEM